MKGRRDYSAALTAARGMFEIPCEFRRELGQIKVTKNEIQTRRRGQFILAVFSETQGDIQLKTASKWGNCQMTATAEEFSPASLRRQWKCASRLVIVAVIVAVVLVVAGIGWLVSRLAEHTTHSPILINGNAGFTHANGVVSGSGTASDPYIIERWAINATRSPGIQIQNTTDWFVVQFCSISGGGDISGFCRFAGICLLNSTNGIVANCTCSNKVNGIWLISSSNNTLMCNTCQNDAIGIGVSESSNITLENNKCSKDGTGMVLEDSSNVTVVYDSCSSCADGICIFWGINNTVAHNHCSSNAFCGITLDPARGTALISNTLTDNLLYGVEIDAGSSNTISNNAFIGNNRASGSYDSGHTQAFDNGTSDWWNGTNGRGNYWSDWTTPDANNDGIVDLSYGIAGDAMSKDYSPLATPP